MTELISIREAARRLGVSDTAIHKAIKAGRVVVAGKTDSGRPQMEWKDTERRWLANSDASKRSHVGSQGSSRREKDAPRVQLATSDRMDEGEATEGAPASGRGAGYAQARAAREVYMAKLAKLEFDERSGKLIDAQTVRAEGSKLAAAVISGLYNIPDRCADEISGMSSAHDIHKLLLSEIDNAVEGLRKQYV